MRLNQALLVRSYRILRPNNLDRRQAADLNLLLIIRERLLRKRQRLLGHTDILIGKHQVPVEVFDLIHRCDDLEPECHVSDFAIILSNADQAVVGYESEALQQVLRKFELERRTDAGAISIESAIRSQTRIVKTN